jgi:glycine/D-amino acid oxidase-like deaminating enzyme
MFYNKDEPKKRIFSYNSKNNKIKSKIEEINDKDKVFGAHFDEGRITRILDWDTSCTWAHIALKSIERYVKLERESGIDFYNEIGVLYVANEDHEFLSKIETVAHKMNILYDKFNGTQLKWKFPFLQVPEDAIGILEKRRAGYINPRKMIEAQNIIAKKNGAILMDDIVHSIKKINQGIMEVKTCLGNTFYSKKVLVTAGAFSNFHELLEKKVDFELVCITVALLELDEIDQKRFQNLPCFLYKYGSSKDNFYILPPIKYPDGKVYLKVGHNSENYFYNKLKTHQEVNQWYNEQGNKEAIEHVLKLVYQTLPGLTPLSIHTDTCVWDVTPSRQLYVDMINSNIGVACGGNGAAAKSSDEIGRLASQMLIDCLSKSNDENILDWHYPHSDIPIPSNMKVKFVSSKL